LVISIHFGVSVAEGRGCWQSQGEKMRDRYHQPISDIGRASRAKLSRNVIQVSDYVPSALILADSAGGLDRRGY
jgi:hypothetical protein